MSSSRLSLSPYVLKDRLSESILSPGSRRWKVGFSGEPDPRAVFWAVDGPDALGGEIWDLDTAQIKGARGDRSEGSRLVAVRLVSSLRETFSKYVISLLRLTLFDIE